MIVVPRLLMRNPAIPSQRNVVPGTGRRPVRRKLGCAELSLDRPAAQASLQGLTDAWEPGPPPEVMVLHCSSRPVSCDGIVTYCIISPRRAFDLSRFRRSIAGWTDDGDRCGAFRCSAVR